MSLTLSGDSLQRPLKVEQPALPSNASAAELRTVRPVSSTPCNQRSQPVMSGRSRAGGDCAESFEAFNANRIRDFYRVILPDVRGHDVPRRRANHQDRPHRRPVRQAAQRRHGGDCALPSASLHLCSANCSCAVTLERIASAHASALASHTSALASNLLRSYRTARAYPHTAATSSMAQRSQRTHACRTRRGLCKRTTSLPQQ